MDDRSIISGLQKRDESALQELDKKYKKLMYFIAFNILGTVSDTEECVNDALLDIWNSIPPQNPDSMETYSALIVRRRAIDRLEYNRAQKRYAPTTSIDELSEIIADDSGIPDNTLAELINAFIAKLTTSDRRVFLQRYYLCLPVERISRNLNINSGTVFSKLSRTKEKLRKYLAENGVKV